MNKHERLGPAPTPEPPDAGGPRALILDRLRHATTPATVRDLATAIEAHANTVRSALAELTEAGQVSRRRLPATGRGRPTYGYSITVTGRNTAPARPAFREYRGLTEAFAAHLSQASHDPGAAARDIGRTWGHSLAAGSAASTDPAPPSEASAGPGRPTDTPPDAPDSADPTNSPHAHCRAQSRVVTLLGELGFSPTADAAGLALRTCPLLDLAREMPEVICQVHQGLLEGAMDHYGDPAGTAELRPFAEVGACRLSFTPTTTATAPAQPSSGNRHEFTEPARTAGHSPSTKKE